MKTKNTNCLEGVECPKCEALEPFAIVGSTVFMVYDDGIEQYTDVEWDKEAHCACETCGHNGQLKEFMKDELPQLPETKGPAG